jgi:hypothetical protein
MPSFDMVPYKEKALSRQPWTFATVDEPPSLNPPEKDTLQAASEWLAAHGGRALYALAEFPRHDHLGGLYVLARRTAPAGREAHARLTAQRFAALLDRCPADWRAAEEPTLIERVSHFAAGE